MQKIAILAPSHNFVGLYLRKARIDNRKKIVKQRNTSEPPPHVLIIWWTSAY